MSVFVYCPIKIRVIPEVSRAENAAQQNTVGTVCLLSVLPRSNMILKCFLSFAVLTESAKDLMPNYLFDWAVRLRCCIIKHVNWEQIFRFPLSQYNMLCFMFLADMQAYSFYNIHIYCMPPRMRSLFRSFTSLFRFMQVKDKRNTFVSFRIISLLYCCPIYKLFKRRKVSLYVVKQTCHLTNPILGFSDNHYKMHFIVYEYWR